MFSSAPHPGVRRRTAGLCCRNLFGHYKLVINPRSVGHSWVGLGHILTYRCKAVQHRKGKKYVFSILL